MIHELEGIWKEVVMTSPPPSIIYLVEMREVTGEGNWSAGYISNQDS
jgi:hypothetical protein